MGWRVSFGIQLHGAVGAGRRVERVVGGRRIVRSTGREVVEQMRKRRVRLIIDAFRVS